MQIKNRLTLQFTGIVALILLFFGVAIYFFSERHRSNDFEIRLKERALITAGMLLEADEIDEGLLKILRRKYLQALSQELVRVYDASGNEVFKDDTLDFQLPEKFFNKILKEGEVSYTNGERQTAGIFYEDNQGDFVVIASAYDMYGHRKLNNLRLMLTLGYFISLIIIFISGRIFSFQAMKPIQKIINQVGNINIPQLHLRVDEGKGKDEISRLAVTFNKMFEKLENAFEMQKTFVSNASHELRTPLTTITGEISVALMKERNKEEYEQVLMSVLEETKALTKLANDLLELAQAGMGGSGIILSELKIKELLGKLREEVSKRNPGLELLVTCEKEDLTIAGNEQLLLTAFLNIVENAFKFSGDKPVTVRVDSTPERINLIISDQGIGMNPEEIKNVFLPFYRSTNVSGLPGHGIGLSLTEKIIKIHEGTIHIFSEPDQGTAFTISLKNQAF